MSPLPSIWTNVLISTHHLAIFCVVVALVGGAVLASVAGTWPQRTGTAVAASSTAALVSPFLVAPVYLSSGVWTWGLALVGTTAVVGTCLTYAVRAALGCVFTSKIEWSAWLVGLIASWLAMILAGAHIWAVGAAATSLAGYLVVRLLPSRITSTDRTDEVVKVTALIALPTILTGVPWAGVPVLLVALTLGALSRRAASQEKRLELARVSVVTSHALTSALPLVLLMFGAPALPAVY